MRRVIFFSPLVLFAFASIYFAFGLTRDPTYTPSMLLNAPVPEFRLSPIQGYTEGLRSDDLKGRVSLLNVFGSWCISCEVEHPFLLSIAAEGIAPLYGLNWKDKPGAGAAWLARRGDPYAQIGNDADGRVAIDFGVTGAPETFVIDASGRVRHKHIGPITPEEWETVLRPMILDLKNAQNAD
ncbi:MAG: DsbE family thiol:disulfide interchange protein [Pseudomonadota bacterium]